MIVTLIICMIFSQLVIGYGSEGVENIQAPQNVTATLVDANGNEYEVIGRLVDTPMMLSTETETFAATYEYEINLESEDLSLPSGDISDSTYSVKAYNTIYWQKTQGTKGTAYKLTKVTGGWRIVDNTVSVSNCMLRYGCTGFGTNDPTTTQRKEIASVSNNFSRSTGFTEYIYQEGGVMGANMTLTLERGSSSVWTLYAENNLFGVGSFW